MSLRSDRLLAAVALRQAWLDERLQVLERRLKIEPPPAPVSAERPEEHLRMAVRDLRAEQSRRARSPQALPA